MQSVISPTASCQHSNGMSTQTMKNIRRQNASFFGRGPQTMCLSLPLLDQFQKYAVRDTCSVWLVNRIDRTCDEHWKGNWSFRKKHLIKFLVTRDFIIELECLASYGRLPPRIRRVRPLGLPHRHETFLQKICRYIFGKRYKSITLFEMCMQILKLCLDEEGRCLVRIELTYNWLVQEFWESHLHLTKELDIA